MCATSKHHWIDPYLTQQRDSKHQATKPKKRKKHYTTNVYDRKPDRLLTIGDLRLSFYKARTEKETTVVTIGKIGKRYGAFIKKVEF